MKLVSLIVMTAAAATLSACKVEEPMSHSQYICPNNVVLDTTFRNGKVVEIAQGEDIITLNRVESASGAKYEGGGMVFWSKGRDAQYSAQDGAEPVDCRRR